MRSANPAATAADPRGADPAPLADPWNCAYCGEPFDAGIFRLSPADPHGFHRECLIRMVAGSVGHQAGRCSCHGGVEGDPPGLGRREAARAAFHAWEVRHGQGR